MIFTNLPLGRINNLELAAKKYGWKRGTKKEIRARIAHVLKGGDREFINGGNYDPVYTNCEQFATFLVFGEKLTEHSN